MLTDLTEPEILLLLNASCPWPKEPGDKDVRLRAWAKLAAALLPGDALAGLDQDALVEWCCMLGVEMCDDGVYDSPHVLRGRLRAFIDSGGLTGADYRW